MTLIRFDDVSLAFGEQKLLTQASFILQSQERVCLVGRNGAGKSTVLRLLMGEQTPDSGEIIFKTDVRLSQLSQQLPKTSDVSVRSFVAEGLIAEQKHVDEFYRLSTLPTTPDILRQLEAIQKWIDMHDAWNLTQKVEQMITQLSLSANKRLGELSGGWQRRVALAQALVSQPDVLLLDEPTNHLDISTIEWLENVVRGYRGSVIFITHDRSFLQKLATRIVEVDRGKLISWSGNYHHFLQQKAQANAAEDKDKALFDKRLAEEEVWIRKGVKARTKRNQGRVRALHSMRAEQEAYVKRQGQSQFDIGQAQLSGRRVIEAKQVNYHIADTMLRINNFNLKVMRGDRLGLIGNNGVGKSTLLKLLLGQLKPHTGHVILGTQLKIGYFDQLHDKLELDKSIAYNIGEGKDYITLNGKSCHVVGYMKKFLFTPERALTPIKALSGGERNRVLLAKLFATESNVLILDEPTNDLDVEMLEALEQQLMAYTGTLIIVSHDRQFLDNIVSSILVFEDSGHIEHYMGNYNDWLQHNKKLLDLGTLHQKLSTATTDTIKPKTDTTMKPKLKKLSYKLQRELTQLPEKIAMIEKEIAELEQLIAAPEFYEQSFTKNSTVLSSLSDKQKTLDEMMARWLILDEKNK